MAEETRGVLGVSDLAPAEQLVFRWTPVWLAEDGRVRPAVVSIHPTGVEDQSLTPRAGAAAWLGLPAEVSPHMPLDRAVHACLAGRDVLGETVSLKWGQLAEDAPLSASLEPHPGGYRFRHVRVKADTWLAALREARLCLAGAIAAARARFAAVVAVERSEGAEFFVAARARAGGGGR